MRTGFTPPLTVGAAILAGIALGNIAPEWFASLAGIEYASVNFVVAVLIWAMIFPMMVAVDFGAVRRVGEKPKGLIITLVVNWLIKPFTMAALGVLFFEVVFADLIAPADAQQYIAGLILLGAAPCTAMVFVWSQLTKGDPAYTLVQVAANDLIMIVAFAPIVALLLGVADIAVPWQTLLLSVTLYVVVPLAAGALVRHRLLPGPSALRWAPSLACQELFGSPARWLVTARRCLARKQLKLLIHLHWKRSFRSAI